MIKKPNTYSSGFPYKEILQRIKSEYSIKETSNIKFVNLQNSFLILI